MMCFTQFFLKSGSLSLRERGTATFFSRARLLGSHDDADLLQLCLDWRPRCSFGICKQRGTKGNPQIHREEEPQYPTLRSWEQVGGQQLLHRRSYRSRTTSCVSGADAPKVERGKRNTPNAEVQEVPVACTCAQTRWRRLPHGAAQCQLHPHRSRELRAPPYFRGRWWGAMCSASVNAFRGTSEVAQLCLCLYSNQFHFCLHIT